MNTGDVIQIEAPDFDPNIDEALPVTADQSTEHKETKGVCYFYTKIRGKDCCM